MSKRIVDVSVLIILAVVNSFAQQRPLLTEDVDTVPSGAVRIGVGVDFQQNANFPLSGLKGDLTRVGDINISVGVNSNVSFEVEGTLQNFLAINSRSRVSPIPLSIPAGAISTNSSGDFTLSTKIKLRNETRNLPAIGFKFGVQLPNSDQSRGIGANQISTFGKILLQKRFGKKFTDKERRLNVFANLGLGILPAPTLLFTQNDVLLYGVAGILKLNNKFNIVGEVNGRANTRKGNAPLGTESFSELRLGTQIRTSGLKFDIAGTAGLNKFSPRTGIIFGVTYESPSIFKPAN